MGSYIPFGILGIPRLTLGFFEKVSRELQKIGYNLI